MKKNYFMLVCLVLFMAFNATAQAVSVADLFGNYKFTADVEFATEEYKKAYGNVIVSECDATIGEDPQGIYDGAVFGFAGVSSALKFNFDGNALQAMNSRDASLGNGLLFADADANNPYGVFKDGSWVVMSFDFSFTYNPSTKEIEVPDFTVVTVANPGSDEKGTLIATYKNAKLTFVGGDEEDTDASAFEWAGTHTLTAANVTAYDGKEYPASFDVTIAKDAAGYYVTNIMGYDVTALNNGGISFTVAADGKSAQMATGTYLYGAYPDFIVIQDMNASSAPINLVLQEDGSVKVDNIFLQGLNYETNKTTPLAYYEGVAIAAAGGSEPEVSAFNWVGQHTVKVGAVEAYDGKTYPTEFTMTVIENAGGYLVTEFFSADVTELNYGGIAFTVAADGKSAEMKSASFVGGAYPDYWVIYDMNAGESPIRFVLNDDGSVTIDNFCVNNCNFESYEESLAALFKDVTIPAAGGSEPEVAEIDWAGTWEVTAGTVTPYDGKEYASKFYMTIVFYPADEYNPAEYLVTQFLSNDITSFNQGGILLSVAEDNSTAEMATDKLIGGKYPDYLKIYDMNAQTTPVVFTANEDGSIAIADFFVRNLNYDTNKESAAVFYQNLTATKCPTGIENVKGENGIVKGIYDIQGRKVEQIAAPGLYIINGKKVFVK